jgi:CDP-glycerol glycerophosphotransferase
MKEGVMTQVRPPLPSPDRRTGSGLDIVWFVYRGLFADNPRAIYDGLVARRGPVDRHRWICTPKTQDSFPLGIEPVLFGTPEAVAALESADLVIGNDCISMEWTKRPGAIYLQTWHGSPLKHIHRDIPNAPAGWLTKPDRDVARWDLLLSPNPPSTGRLRSAFGFRGPIHETGYPRNDVLSRPDRDERRAKLRADLGIPDGTTAVLYAPTWRDDLVLSGAGTPQIRLPLDLDDFAARLGPDHVLLVRLHNIVSDRLVLEPDSPVIDVSDRPESADLYLAADMLVTDYSSAMFDFALTGKPMLFFTYDLEHYRDDLRGFYVDLAEIAPGPLLRTRDELVAAISDIDRVVAEHAGSYARFRKAFCGLEDGQATERVLDLLFPSGASAPGTTTHEGDDNHADL